MSTRIEQGTRIADNQEQQSFCDQLEQIPGILARRYDNIHRERLTNAGHAIHAWLSALDLTYQPAALRMTLAKFADTWAQSVGPGPRRFEAVQQKIVELRCPKCDVFMTWADEDEAGDEWMCPDCDEPLKPTGNTYRCGNSAGTQSLPPSAVARWRGLMQQERNDVIDELRDNQAMDSTTIDIVCELLEALSEDQ